jgi:HEAT repeat protein
MKTKLKKYVTAHKNRNRRLEKALHAIRQGDDFEREKSMEYLISRPNKKTVEHVLPLLQEKDTSTRMAVVEVIKKIGHENVAAIDRLLEDGNEDIRVYACEIMASMKNPETIPFLIKALNDGAENVKNAAVIALGEFNDERAVKALLGMLQDDQWIVFSAICSLGKIKHPSSAAPLLQIFKNGEEELSLAACEVLMEFEDDDILDKMFNILKGWSKKKRKRYIEVIIQQGNENLFLRLKQSIGQDLFEHLLAYVDFDKKELIPILKLIIHFKSKQTCDILLETLIKMDPDEPEYYEVLQLFASLSQVWKNNIKEYLRKGDEFALVVIKACAQEKIRIPENILLESFLSSSVLVKREITKNAALIVQGKGYDLLKMAVKDADGHVKSYAVNAIGTMKMKKLESEIIDLSISGFMDVRINAIKILLDLNDNAAKQLLKQFVDSGSLEDKKVYLAVAKNIAGDDNFPLIQKLFQSKNEDIKKTVVTIVGNFIDDEKYATIFQKLLQGDNIPHEVLKIIKEKRLGQFKSVLNKIFSNTSKSLWTRYYALLALGSFEDPSLFELFVNGLNDENNLIKIGSLKALSDLKDKKAVVFVKPLTKHKDDDVRSTAEFVMNNLKDS